MQVFTRSKSLRRILSIVLLIFISVTSINIIYASDSNNSSIEYIDGKTGKLPKLGSNISNFTVTEIGELDILDADTIKFVHKKSGGELLYIKNDDKNLGFSIGYVTPQVDETDVNHIFEHAIIASSKKYKSKDIFFDMLNKSYNTYVNATTTSINTIYPVMSQNENQLIKMADVYLSCMVDPDVIHDENFFRREAIRYELESTDSDLVMKGTVFNEDYGYSTSVNRNMYHAITHTLFGDTYNANCVGRLFENYDKLTYEKTLQTYYRNYHFDNSLIVLYGDMDYIKFLDFLDKEYLGREDRNNTNIDMYFKAPVPEGHETKICDLQVTNDFDPTEADSVCFAAVTDDFDAKDIVAFKVLSNVLNNAQSKFQKEVRDAGISGMTDVDISADGMKKFVAFSLDNTKQTYAGRFESIVKNTLKDIAQNGVNQDELEGVLTSIKINDGLVRENSNAFVDILFDIYPYWTTSKGKVDYYSDRRLVLNELEKDKEQKLIKYVAHKVLNSARTSLIVGVPKPGLSEEADKKREEYLSKILDKMSDEDKKLMVEATKVYKEWEDKEMTNSSFIIHPDEIEDYSFDRKFTREFKSDKLVYTKQVNGHDIAGVEFIFDISNLNPEDGYYYSLLKMLLGNIPTFDHEEDALSVLKNKYLFALEASNMFYEETSKNLNHPSMGLSFFTLSENIDKSLDCLYEIIYKSDYSITPKITKYLDMKLPNYNLGQYGSGSLIAEEFAMAGFRYDRAMNAKLEDQGFYDFLVEINEKLKNDKSYSEQFVTKMRSLITAIFNPENMIISIVADEKNMDELKSKIVDFADKRLLPYEENLDEEIPLYEGGLDLHDTRVEIWKEYIKLPDNIGIITASPNQHIRVKSVIKTDNLSYAKTAPFVNALSDKYIIPKIRFSGTAYSAGARSSCNGNLLTIYSYSDTEGKNTIDIIKNSGEALEDMNITKEDLDGYILSAIGREVTPEGKFTGAFASIHRDLKGINLDEYEKEINSIKETTISDKENAIKNIKDALSNMHICLLGSNKKVNEAGSILDEVYDWTSNEKSSVSNN